jgi:hypothetical protein
LIKLFFRQNGKMYSSKNMKVARSTAEYSRKKVSKKIFQENMKV